MTEIAPQAHVDPLDSAPLTETVPQYVWEYAKEQDALKRAADQMRDYLYELSTEALIPVHTIETRAKSLTSYMRKCSLANWDGSPKYPDPPTQIDDCVAARVIVYTTRARRDFLGLLTTRCHTRDHANPGNKKHNGYDSDHLIVTAVDAGHLSARYPDLATYLRQRPGLEVQIRTVAGHAWAEYEHDVRYKSAAYKKLDDGDRGRVDQWFIEAGGLRRYLDQVFNDIDEFLVPTDVDEEEAEDVAEEIEDSPTSDGDSRPLDAESLIELIENRYPDLETGNDGTIEQILTQLRALNINTIAELTVALDRIDQDEVESLMDYPIAVSAARRLDDDLLAAFGRRYVDAAADDEPRRQLLSLRLRRVSGKFNIYALVVNGAETTRPMPAARAVRELARIAADTLGPEGACIENAIALTKSDLLNSTNPRAVATRDAEIYVATNLLRSHAEFLMRELVDRLPHGLVEVYRAGDRLFPPTR